MTVQKEETELSRISESLLEQEAVLASIAGSLKSYTEQSNDYLSLQKKFVGSLDDIHKVYQIINAESNQWLESSKAHIRYHEEIYPNIINENEKYLKNVTSAIYDYSSKIEYIQSMQKDFELSLNEIMKSTRDSFHESDFFKLHNDFKELINKFDSISTKLNENLTEKIDIIGGYLKNESNNRDSHSEYLKNLITAETNSINTNILLLNESLQIAVSKFHIDHEFKEDILNSNDEIISHIDKKLEFFSEKTSDIVDSDYDEKLHKMQATLGNIQACQSLILLNTSKKRVKKWPRNLIIFVSGILLLWLSPEQVSEFAKHIINFFINEIG